MKNLIVVVSLFVSLFVVSLFVGPAAFADTPFLVVPGGECDPKGQFCNVPHKWTGFAIGGTIVSGDIKINDVPLYDSRKSSGLLAVLPMTITEQITITAEWGAFITWQETGRVDMIANDMLIQGCDLPNGCDSVAIFDVLSNQYRWVEPNG